MACLRWVLGLGIATMMVAVPWMHFRATYAHEKRLREVCPGKLYRCGQLTADGFREVFQHYGIRTVINLQQENPDPLLPPSYYRAAPAAPESEVCRQSGVRYVLIKFDLPRRDKAATEPPASIGAFLEILDDPASYPVLLHCKAGLHRTGLLTAVSRMEYEHWPVAEALRELRANGFGDTAATSADDYIYAYLELYQPRWRRSTAKPGCLEKAGGPPDAGEGPP